NNETGVIQHYRQIAEIVHDKGALFLSDATQAFGKQPIDVLEDEIDLLAFSGHKFYGPKGIGGLYISSKAFAKPQSLIHGGSQQRNRRSGTVNVPGIVAMGKASQIARDEMEQDFKRIMPLRDRLENGLLQIDGAFVNGGSDRLFNTTNICFPGIDSAHLILQLRSIAVSNGSACTAITPEPSHVLKALGLSNSDALASIRFSLGKYNTHQEIETTIKTVTKLVQKWRDA
ncbi:MAG: aminotransferase class V-fold PLP-dependent enzyme, partial [Chitinophagaceae bacterium]